MQHRKDVDTIKSMLVDGTTIGAKQNATPGTKTENATDLLPIGVIRSIFSEKRAVPRQSVLANETQGCVEVNCFNNPEHSLDGLQDFSHMWIIYHFHRNETHSKAKVAPPRLNGERVGVFSTRSPHRPCPIGLSLVRIDRIEGNRVYFFGTDMVDNTPVFDLKPYIPKYDCPMVDAPVDTGRKCTARSGGNANSIFPPPVAHSSSSTPLDCAREAPDGQETSQDTQGAVGQVALAAAVPSNSGPVRVPNWITAGPTLKVLFNDQALSQIEELDISRRTITELLETDPRSVYLRTKHGSQIFTFQLSEVTVTCKFDDSNSIVTVVQVRI